MNGVWTPPNTKEVTQRIRSAGSYTEDILGGERGWFGNEAGFHDWDNWKVQTSMDPGRFETINHMIDAFLFRNSGTLEDFQTNDRYKFEVDRTFSKLEDPFSATDVTYVGFGLRYSIAITSTDLSRINNPKVNPWSLMTTYSGTKDYPGTVIAITNPGAKSITYEDDKQGLPMGERVRIEDAAVYFRTDNVGCHQIAVKPEDLRYVDDHAVLMKVNQVPDGSGLYELTVKRVPDTPLDRNLPATWQDIHDIPHYNPEGERGTLQAYNGPAPSDATQRFTEMEFMLAPLVRTRGGYERTVHLEVIQYRGEFDKIVGLVQRIGQMSNVPYLFASE
jgi:hypothetical protein